MSASSDSLKYIRDTYDVPANIGQRIRFCGDTEGVIVGGTNAHLKCQMDGDKKGRLRIYHPTWNMEYLNEKIESAT